MRGPGFGVARDAFEKVYVPGRKYNNDKTQPGPGMYGTHALFGKEGRTITFRKKPEDINGKQLFLNNNLLLYRQRILE